MVPLKTYLDGYEYSFSEKGAMPTSSDTQLPYEERETEKDDELQDSFSLVCLIAEPVLFIPINYQNKTCDESKRLFYTIIDIPLYLSKRALLI
jgi:hypothetical protein